MALVESESEVKFPFLVDPDIEKWAHRTLRAILTCAVTQRAHVVQMGTLSGEDMAALATMYPEAKFAVYCADEQSRYDTEMRCLWYHQVQVHLLTRSDPVAKDLVPNVVFAIAPSARFSFFDIPLLYARASKLVHGACEFREIDFVLKETGHVGVHQPFGASFMTITAKALHLANNDLRITTCTLLTDRLGHVLHTSPWVKMALCDTHVELMLICAVKNVGHGAISTPLFPHNLALLCKPCKCTDEMLPMFDEDVCDASICLDWAN